VLALTNYYHTISQMYSNPVPIPVAAQSKAWVCGRSLAGIVGSNPIRGRDIRDKFVV
jgi:hypothetical protein